MFTSLRAILATLELAKVMVRWAERNNWINEGERRQIQLEMEAVLKALKKRDKTHDEVDKMTDEEVDAALRADGDVRLQ